MNIKIQSRGFQQSHTLNDYVSSKVYFLLGRYSGRIKHTEVVLSEVHGNKREKDMKCLIKLKLNHFKSIVVSDTASDIYDAASNCVQRAKRTLDRQLNRMRKQQRSVEYRYA